ncbi:hypothetical protein FWH30_02600 [Microgenomates group bacterium]|nr:hypothetical protein [Microgenomates group bacterium]
MQQHAIPQDIIGYKFNLFGKLNLVQFLQLIIPCGLTALMWRVGTPLILLIPLGILLVGYGLMAAFVPIGGRPVSHWSLTFLHNLYAPTKFYWRKGEFVPDYFDSGTLEGVSEVVDSHDSLWGEGDKVVAAHSYFSSIKGMEEEDPLELGQKLQIEGLLNSFDDVRVANVNAVPMTVKPKVNNEQALRARQLQGN